MSRKKVRDMNDNVAWLIDYPIRSWIIVYPARQSWIPSCGKLRVLWP
jgi:hypothetical protein